MAVLAATLHDPATAVAKSTTALLAMTALDTINLRVAFTVPANGRVAVRISCVLSGGTTYPQVLLGVLEGTTVRGRMAPTLTPGGTALATTFLSADALFVVSGLTVGASLVWDAAYGVETLVAGTAIRYGGPNDTTANNAWGGFAYEVWEA